MTTITSPVRPSRPLPRKRHRGFYLQPATYVLLAVLAAFTVLPFVWVITGSLRSTADIAANPGAWWPSTLDSTLR